MNTSRVTIAVVGAVSLAALLGGLPAAAEQAPPTPAPSPAAVPAPEAVAPAPAGNAAVEEIIKLYNAKFSEDFIRRKIKNDGTVFNLSTADLLRLKEAGIPEGLVEAMLATRKGSSEVPAPVTGAAPVAMPTPVAPPPGLVLPTPPSTTKTWDGLVRRSSGAVLGIGSRWENGVLRVENEQVKWIAAEKTERNLLIPVKALTEQFLTCEKRPQGDCFEWGFKTKDGDYFFRDTIWKTGPSTKPTDVYEFFKAAFPNLAYPKYYVDERK